MIAQEQPIHRILINLRFVLDRLGLAKQVKDVYILVDKYKPKQSLFSQAL